MTEKTKPKPPAFFTDELPRALGLMQDGAPPLMEYTIKVTAVAPVQATATYLMRRPRVDDATRTALDAITKHYELWERTAHAVARERTEAPAEEAPSPSTRPTGAGAMDHTAKTPPCLWPFDCDAFEAKSPGTMFCTQIRNGRCGANWDWSADETPKPDEAPDGP